MPARLLVYVLAADIGRLLLIDLVDAVSRTAPRKQRDRPRVSSLGKAGVFLLRL
jgi:hypothetical protein